MDPTDSLLDDNPTMDGIPIRVYPVTSCNMESLNDAFTKKTSTANRCSLKRQHTLQQYDLARAPFLDAVMGSECSKPYKSMDYKCVVLAAQHLEVVAHILQCLGLIINTKMSLTQELEFLGMLENTYTLLASLSADRVKEIIAEAIRISNTVSLSAHLLSHFLSTATHTIPPAPQFYHCLQRLSTTVVRFTRFLCPITTHPRKSVLLERTPIQMEWEAPKGKVRSSYHQLRCLPTRLGAACVNNCTSSAW